MTLVRWNPIRDIDRWHSDFFGVQRDINRLFDNFLRGGVQADESFDASYWTPAVDISEQENSYVVNVELPGVSKGDVKISLESNVLTIKGEKKAEKEESKKNLHRVERSYGAFQRSFTLPTTVKSENIEAVFTDGVLKITLPKAEETRAKQIEVKVK